MKHKFTIVVALAAFFITVCTSSYSQINFTETLLREYTKTQADSMLDANGVPSGIFSTQYGVKVYRIVYDTPDGQGNPSYASGLIILPVGDSCQVPIISYNHGTQLKKDDVFSNLQGEWVIGVVAASTGYAACLPDYLGMGQSPGFHPYQHAKTEASATIDLIRACNVLGATNNINLNGQIFLMGYSQGGHAAMATHREIQENYVGELTVTASAPMSGAYDMSGAQFDMVSAFTPYSVPGYLPYLLKGYKEVYGDTLFANWDEILKAPYNTTIPPKLTGEFGIGDVNNIMPQVPREIIDSTYSANFFADSLHPFRLALKDNNVYQWVPQSWMRINYCGSDEEVNPQNAINAYNYMITNGATTVSIAERSTTLGHFECAQPTILYTKFWFDSLATKCLATGIKEEVTTPGWTVLNNCTDGKIYGTIYDGISQPYNIYIFNSAGSLVKAYEGLTEKEFTLDVANLASSMYVIRCDVGRGLWYKFIK